jgi:peptidoglycan/LPS O-acetylase OafA/YrhL
MTDVIPTQITAVNSLAQVSSGEPSDSARAPARLHLVLLDGVRGFAAMWVLLNHVIDRSSTVFAPGRGLVRWVLAAVSGGHWAVDIFIVLSGFCLMIPVARRGRLEGGSVHFFRKRAHRILPPYFACLLIMLAYGLCVHHLSKHAQPIASARAVLANIFLFEDWVPGTDSINGVFWSVAVEWKIYFLLPCFVLLWRRSQVLMMLTATVIGLGAIPLLHLAFPQNNLSRACPWYVILFAFGLLSAGLVLDTRPKLPRAKVGFLLGAVAVVFGIAALSFYHWFPPVRGLNNEGTAVDWRMPVADLLAGAAIAAGIGLLAKCVADARRNWVLAFFELRPLVWIGTMGYSLYLLHPLALNVVEAAANRLPGGARSREVVVLLAGVPISIAAAYAFYWSVESRFLNRKGRQTIVA